MNELSAIFPARFVCDILTAVESRRAWAVKNGSSRGNSRRNQCCILDASFRGRARFRPTGGRCHRSVMPIGDRRDSSISKAADRANPAASPTLPRGATLVVPPWPPKLHWPYALRLLPHDSGRPRAYSGTGGLTGKTLRAWGRPRASLIPAVKSVDCW